MKKQYIKPQIRIIDLYSESQILGSSKDWVRGYAIDNYEQDDDNVIEVQKQDNYFQFDLD